MPPPAHLAASADKVWHPAEKGINMFSKVIRNLLIVVSLAVFPGLHGCGEDTGSSAQSVGDTPSGVSLSDEIANTIEALEEQRQAYSSGVWPKVVQLELDRMNDVSRDHELLPHILAVTVPVIDVPEPRLIVFWAEREPLQIDALQLATQDGLEFEKVVPESYHYENRTHAVGLERRSVWALGEPESPLLKGVLSGKVAEVRLIASGRVVATDDASVVVLPNSAGAGNGSGVTSDKDAGSEQ